jgi:5'-deoxynucleotidase YfbR-like HD superfamily hydrolase
MSRSKRLHHSTEPSYEGRLVEALFVSSGFEEQLPAGSDVRLDVNVIYKLFDLQKLIRFVGQRHWEAETASISLSPGTLELENVAAHSFQVARSAFLLAPHFPWIDISHAIELALVHDEPEILTGDKDPVGDDGQGSTTHAFNERKRREKDEEERAAIDLLAVNMRPSIRDRYKQMFAELSEGRTAESAFVKALDKLQSLAYVRLRKGSGITPEHAAFTIRYSKIGLQRFPFLGRHFLCVLKDLLEDVASARPDGDIESFCALTWSHLKGAEKL